MIWAPLPGALMTFCEVIKIELVKTRVNKGRVLHSLQLRDTSKGSPEDVLSEGEHGIVSLDQDFEEAVVQRLVELSKKRQVIVFTHWLSLLGLIQDYGEKANCKPHVICVRQEPWGTGEPGDTPLWAAKPKKANNILLDQRLRDARNIYNNEGQQAYDVYAQSLCSEFRKLLEKTIEYDLLADVLHRHRREVHTKNKLNELAKINSDDCPFLDDLMTKYSRYEHSQSNEAPVTLPAPDELQSDMEALNQTWRL